MRTIIVGDIHGCYREFINLLKKAGYHPSLDRLILLGDLMDRGPLSYEMLTWAIRRKEKDPDSFFLVRGNHEQYIVDQPGELDIRLIWRLVGKKDTVRSFARHKDRMELYIPWILQNMPCYYIDKDQDFQCVHAAIEHENPEDNPLDLLVKDHSWSKKNLYAGKLTIIGHTPLPAPTYYDGSGDEGIPLTYHVWNPLPGQGAICIDTGCVFGDRLTAMIVEDGKYYLEYVCSNVHKPNRAYPYAGWVRRFCSLPIVRRFSSDSDIK